MCKALYQAWGTQWRATWLSVPPAAGLTKEREILRQDADPEESETEQPH